MKIPPKPISNGQHLRYGSGSRVDTSLQDKVSFHGNGPHAIPALHALLRIDIPTAMSLDCPLLAITFPRSSTLAFASVVRHIIHHAIGWGGMFRSRLTACTRLTYLWDFLYPGYLPVLNGTVTNKAPALRRPYQQGPTAK